MKLTIREAKPADAPAVARLAALDSAEPPRGRVLVGETDTSVLAAVPVAGGRPIADPFRPTAEVVDLLLLRRAQLG